MRSLRVTAVLDGPSAGIAGNAFMLDGPLSWVEAVTGDYPPLSREKIPDIPLPLGRWDCDGQWGWMCSAAHYEVVSYSALEIRRKPSDREYARLTRDRKNHHALGPYKARDLVVETELIPEVWWDVVVTDRDWFDRLLSGVTHLGARRAVGLGRVRDWQVFDGPDHGWKDRPFTVPCRPPYWHPAWKVQVDAH